MLRCSYFFHHSKSVTAALLWDLVFVCCDTRLFFSFSFFLFLTLLPSGVSAVCAHPSACFGASFAHVVWWYFLSFFHMSSTHKTNRFILYVIEQMLFLPPVFKVRLLFVHFFNSKRLDNHRTLRMSIKSQEAIINMPTYQLSQYSLGVVQLVCLCMRDAL